MAKGKLLMIAVVLTIIIVSVVAFIVNGVEDYLKVNSTVGLSFTDTMNQLDLPIVTLVNNGHAFKFLIDTGATLSIVDSLMLDKLNYTELNTKGSAYGIDGNISEVNYIKMDISHKDTVFTEEFQVIRMKAFDNISDTNNIQLTGILGNSFLRKYKYKIDFENLIAYSKQ